MLEQRTRIKFCGMTNVAEVALAVEAGADAVGVIVAAASPRMVERAVLPELAASIPPYVSRVGVVTSPSEADAATLRALGFTLQFSGEELPAQCERLAAGHAYVKAFHLRDDTTYDAVDFDELAAYEGALWMFDSRVGQKLGGTGVPFVWELVAPVARRRRIVVSGGLTPENVGACVRAVRPYAVDTRSGVETDGRKDPRKMQAFVRAVREADDD